MTEREKRIAIITVVIVVIILLLLWWKKAQRIIPYFDDTNMSVPNFGDFNFSLGDLVIPDLSFYQGVNSCGCGDDEKSAPSMPSKDMKQETTLRSIPIQQSTPQRQRMALQFVSGAALPPRNYAHNSSFWNI